MFNYDTYHYRLLTAVPEQNLRTNLHSLTFLGGRGWETIKVNKQALRFCKLYPTYTSEMHFIASNFQVLPQHALSNCDSMSYNP